MLLSNNRITLLYNFSQYLFQNSCKKLNTVLAWLVIMARLAGLIQIYSLHYMYVWKSRLYKLACVLLIIDFVDHVQKKYKFFSTILWSCILRTRLQKRQHVKCFERVFFAPLWTRAVGSKNGKHSRKTKIWLFCAINNKKWGKSYDLWLINPCIKNKNRTNSSLCVPIVVVEWMRIICMF